MLSVFANGATQWKFNWDWFFAIQIINEYFHNTRTVSNNVTAAAAAVVAAEFFVCIEFHVLCVIRGKM